MEKNTRPLRARNNAFHVGRVALDAGLSMCDFCDRRSFDCDKPAVQKGCGDIVPALFFNDHTGLNGRFSTFRASAIWYDRAAALMQSHKTVALLDSETLERIGRARIRNAHRGPFWALMELHAHTNHLFKDQHLPPPEARDKLTAWVKSNMGSRYVKERDALCTVLYLERV
jgi:hypothetical protein